MKYFFLMLLLLANLAEARYRAVPLMPSRDTAEDAQRLKASKKNTSHENPPLAAIEFGMLGGGGLEGGEALGLQWLWGGKIEYRLPLLTDKFRFRPGLGYFRKSQSEGAVAISQNVIEASLGLDWLLAQTRYVDFSVGMQNHIDILFSHLSVYGSSSNSPVSARYRIAPLVGAQLHLSRTLILAADLEYGLIPQAPARTYGAWTMGIAFPF